ncbi:Protein WHAT'S THIS FACTOR 1-like [Vitis vinifera]|uniref:Protein WHAT'S THIS FACTOR 1-like n=1 Tax=Vitis vinifera TaxID=29760 RepID=A0A438JL30_VITVI|nr:Protein WHAT'S THIS FACTOR 1-like [Vitis vinifera]
MVSPPSSQNSSTTTTSNVEASFRVRLKWVKNRSLDHIIDTETDLKAVCLLKDAINAPPAASSPQTPSPTGRSFWVSPSLFFASCAEESIHQTHEADTVERLCKVLMMMKTSMVPLQSLSPLKWDLGLPDDYHRTLIPKYPDHFRVIKASNGVPCLRLGGWREEFAVSALQKSHERGELDGKKVKAWMEEFQKLPYISPYEDSRLIDPNSELMEKRVVGVLHEFLSLTIHKKTKRNYLRSLREELNLPHKFTRIFTRYPGIFYLSLKCKTTTVAIREGYRRGKLASPHPLARIREKYNYVMRTGVLYRGKGTNMMPQEDVLLDDGEDTTEQEESVEEEPDIDDECNKEDTSEEDLDSDED